MLDLFPESTDDLEWMARGLCRDLAPEDVALFFVDPGRSVDPHVLSMCRTCPVRELCAGWAYDQGRPAGYFGGLSPTQRKRMTKEQAMAFCVADREEALAAVRQAGLTAATPLKVEAEADADTDALPTGAGLCDDDTEAL